MFNVVIGHCIIFLGFLGLGLEKVRLNRDGLPHPGESGLRSLIVLVTYMESSINLNLKIARNLNLVSLISYDVSTVI